MRKVLWLMVMMLSVVAMRAQNYTQGYTQIVVFGDSLSDTGNFARTVQNGYGIRVPGPMFGYTDGRFTDGTDTSPAARLYNGVWLEQMATTLTPVPVVKASLDGGTDYAFGDATNAAGSQNVTVVAGVNVTIQNVGGQIATYLATKPVITGKMLFVVWGGANDLLQATSPATAATSAIANVQALIAVGATQLMVPNLPPLGAIPELNTTAIAGNYTVAAAAYNAALAAGLAQLTTANPKVTIYSLDVFSLFSAILPSPAVTGFANVTNSAQGLSTINPDTYLFWDGLHPTTYGHSLLSRSARNVLTQTLLSGTTLALSSSTASPGQTVTLTAKAAVQSAIGVVPPPSGLMTFYSGAIPIGTVVMDASGTGTTTLTAAQAASPYALTAKYSGDATFTSSTSNSATLTVVAPGYTLAASPSTVVTTRGTLTTAGTTVITMTSFGNLAGTFSPSCGTLPAYVTCSFANALQVSNNSTSAVTLSFSTAVSAASEVPARPGSLPALPVSAGFVLVGGAGFAARRRVGLRPAVLGVLSLLALAGVTGLSGCGGSGTAATKASVNYAAVGTYTIPVNVTPAVSGSSSTLNVTLVVQ